jgi:tRNA dimethylallyltransferase
MRGGVLESPPSDPALREALTREAEQKGNEHMWNRLREVDHISAEKIHMNNLRRVIRALEIYELSGKTKAYFDSLTAKESDIIRVGMITLDFYKRENLYSRVDRRVDIMMQEGLLDEVRSLYEAGLLGEETTAAQAIGYKELKGYLEGRVTLEEALEELKLASRRYAKRQLTWFRRERAYRLMIDTVEGKMKGSEELICEAVDAAQWLLSEIMLR